MRPDTDVVENERSLFGLRSGLYAGHSGSSTLVLALHVFIIQHAQTSCTV